MLTVSHSSAEKNFGSADGAPAAVFGEDAIWREGPGGPAVAEVWRAAGLPAPWPVSAATATRVR